VFLFGGSRAGQGTERSGGAGQISHLALRRGRKIAEVAVARRLAVCLYWMWRNQRDYQQLKEFGPRAGQPGTGVAVK
jgi:hypothetical protein